MLTVDPAVGQAVDIVVLAVDIVVLLSSAIAGVAAVLLGVSAAQRLLRDRRRRANTERFLVMLSTLMPTDVERQLADMLLAEVARQDILHPDGFPANRDGIRLAIAVAADDELNREAYEAWREARCKCATPRCDHADWSAVGGEMMQAMAVVFRCVRSIAERAQHKEEVSQE